MRTVCLVNNFNYAHFLDEALSSVERQSVAFDLVVVVDDGSTDNSRDIISAYCDRLPNWEVLYKKNGGQLSCFNACLPFVAADDLVTLLDADDIYPPDYLQSLLSKSEQLEADIYFSDLRHFENSEELKSVSASLSGNKDFLVASSTALTRYLKRFIGRPTSAVALRGYLYQELLPYPYEREWITRADDVIVHGASILNARKAFMATLCVGYRVHGSNHFHRKTFSKEYKLRRDHFLEKMYGWYCHQQHLNPVVDFERVKREYALIPEALRKGLNLPEKLPRPSHLPKVENPKVNKPKVNAQKVSDPKVKKKKLSRREKVMNSIRDLIKKN